jgi:2-dehydropantoate 2-reductase
LKILVYGAGVIGSLLTHTLCVAGNDVSLLARGEWAEILKENGLRIHHWLQRNDTVDHPEIVTEIDENIHYDAVFTVMQYDQTVAIKEQLGKVWCDTLVMIGNQLSFDEMEQYIAEHSVHRKEILFGFIVAAGYRNDGKVLSRHIGAGRLELGYLRKPVSDELKRNIQSMFRGTKWKLTWNDEMASFLACHPAFILPSFYLMIAKEFDLRKVDRRERKLWKAASRECYDMLLSIGIKVNPKGDDALFRGGPMGCIGTFMLFLCTKTAFGEMILGAHGRHSVSEAVAMEQGWNRLMEKKPERCRMPNFERLKAMCPPLQELG